MENDNPHAMTGEAVAAAMGENAPKPAVPAEPLEERGRDHEDDGDEHGAREPEEPTGELDPSEVPEEPEAE